MKGRNRVARVGVPSAGHLVAQDAPDELAREISAHAAAWLGADDALRSTFG